MVLKRHILLAVVVSFGLIQPASAFSFRFTYTQCGIGGIVGKALSDESGIVAVVTNLTDLGTTAVSSAMSDACYGRMGVMASLIYETYDPIEQDLAQGQGEYLDALLTAAECNVGIRSSVVGDIRRDFSKQVASSSYAAQTQYVKAENLFNLFRTTTEQCLVKG